MRVLLNIIWLVFGGFWLALGYVAFGILACILIVTIPFGIAAFRIAGYALWPFGRTIVARPTAGVGSTIGNVIWVLVAGIWLTIGHVLTAAAQAITIIGIPLALANLKMIPISLVPLGKDIVPVGATTTPGPPAGRPRSGTAPAPRRPPGSRRLTARPPRRHTGRRPPARLPRGATAAVPGPR